MTILAATYIKRILQASILGLGLFFVGSLIWLFSKRLVYPYELDWIEGGALVSVIRILNGQSLYVAPSIDYVPFIYTPAYFYLAAFVAKFFGASLLTLRLVSAGASLLSLITIALIVWSETKSWFWGLASAGLFAGLYPASRFWFDLARVDSVFLMFFLLFIFCLRRGDTARWQVLAGIFASMAILSKQTGVTMCLPIAAVYILFDWKRRLILPLTITLVYGAISLAFILTSGSWYLYYCYGLLLSQQDNWNPYTFWQFINEYIFPNLLIATILSLLIFLLWSSRDNKERLLLWLTIFVTTIITSYVGRAKVGGVVNVIIPTLALFSILFGICLAEIPKVFKVPSSRHLIIMEISLCIIALFQAGQLIYNPTLHAPSIENYNIGVRALKLVKKVKGNVFLPNSAISIMAGKQTFAHPYAMWEILHSHGDSWEKDLLKNELQKVVDARFFDTIIVLPSVDYFPDLEKYYDLSDDKYILVDENWFQRASVYVLQKSPTK